ncbi:MAG TPA: TonB-dependent receptor [Usitatibacter sp.]|nr:TonB-dependent receptor [Usitatibacter sp.]
MLEHHARRLVHHWLGALLAAVLALAAPAALAADINDVRPFDIRAQPLDRALIEFSRQAGFQIVSNSAEVARLQSTAVSGSKTVGKALEELLAGSGLTFRVIGADVIAVERGRKMAEGAPVQHAEAVVVTGTHIRGLVNQTAPVTILDRAYIESTGYATTAQLIESLPQNFALTTPGGTMATGITESRLQGSAINLRGLGEGTTLVLLNGRRLALSFLGTGVDISALPLSAIERVEVLTDGASAIYGSDAVGGVVNFVLRKDFSGMETRARAGWAEGGVDEQRISHVVGHSWNSGNAVFSTEYYQRDMLLASKRDYLPDASIIGSLYPRDENASFLFSGRQSLTGSLGVFADAIYMHRRSYNESGRFSSNETYRNDNPQMNATVGLNWQLGRDWAIEAAGGYARNTLHQRSTSTLQGPLGDVLSFREFEVTSANVKADGALFTLPGGRVRAAFGADWRKESLLATAIFSTGAFAGNPIDLEQDVRSLFGEVYVPLVGAANRIPGIHRLELSIAGRYDDYDRFGSHTDPKAGIMWEPASWLRIRGSYGTSYVAPRLADYNILGTNQALSLFSPDPGAGNAITHQLIVLGNSDDLKPQKSKNSTLGFVLTPPALRGFRLETNYFRIEYEDRIANTPLTAILLGNPASFASLVIRNPSIADVERYIAIARQGLFGLRLIPPTRAFDPATVAVIVDQRRRNLSLVETSGYDVAAQYDMRVAGGEMQVGLTATYIKDLVQQVTPSSVPFSSVDTIHNPVQLRLRGALAYARGPWTGNLFVNHVSAYEDNRLAPFQPIGSFTTVDARIAYDFGKGARRGFLSGLTVALSAQNLFDKDPPITRVINNDRDIGYDPTNANPLGRMLALELTKTW